MSFRQTESNFSSRPEVHRAIQVDSSGREPMESSAALNAGLLATTHLEAALLQSFPETFEWCGKRIKVGIQIGNAVPPILARVIADHVATMIGFGKSEKLRIA